MEREANDADLQEQAQAIDDAAVAAPPPGGVPIDAPEPDVLEQNQTVRDPDVVPHDVRPSPDAAEADLLEQAAEVPLDDDDERR